MAPEVHRHMSPYVGHIICHQNNCSYWLGRDRHLIGMGRPFHLFVFAFGPASTLLYRQSDGQAGFAFTPQTRPARAPALWRETVPVRLREISWALAHLTAKGSQFWESLQTAIVIKNTLGQNT